MTGTNLHWWKWLVIYWKHFFWNAWRTEHGHGELQIQLLVILLLRLSGMILEPRPRRWAQLCAGLLPPMPIPPLLMGLLLANQDVTGRGLLPGLFPYYSWAFHLSACKSGCDVFILRGILPIPPLLLMGLLLEGLQMKMWCQSSYMMISDPEGID